MVTCPNTFNATQCSTGEIVSYYGKGLLSNPELGLILMTLFVIGSAFIIGQQKGENE